jgi:hypothetical protein
MTRLLLCGVVKPYGIKDDTSEPLCTMELLNNQVTREQGIHSPRSSNPSFALFLLAENINVPTTVLDFPDWKEFTREIDSGTYTHIGISFIVPNVLKAAQMARYVRAHSPKTKILLGGHGTSIPGIRGLVECDEICRGEGIVWLRKYFGEEEERPCIHPVVPSAVNSYVYGAPIMGKAGIIIPGVGCQNSCRFCATSHKFDRKYTPFLRTGRDIFDACRKTEEKLGVDDFGLMDENFCKSPERARDLMEEMEQNRKAYTFSIFSSAEAITQLGIDFLVRIGVNFVWIGVESKHDLFEKTRGIDLHDLINGLQAHGISVLASSILFLENHDKETIHEDIDWAIGLESDLMQFMELGPSPGTRLYQEYEAEGKIIRGIPWPKQHGQDEIWFRHPHFSLSESAEYLRDAFIKKYHMHGPSVLNMAKTALHGFINVKAEIEERERLGLAWDPAELRYVQGSSPSRDEYMRLRLEAMRKNALRFRPMLSSTLRYAPNAASAQKCREIMKQYDLTLGPMSLGDRLKSMAVRVLAIRESRRMKKDGPIMRQPPSHRVSYPERSIGSPDQECEPADFESSDEQAMQLPAVSSPRR